MRVEEPQRVRLELADRQRQLLDPEVAHDGPRGLERGRGVEALERHERERALGGVFEVVVAQDQRQRVFEGEVLVVGEPAGLVAAAGEVVGRVPDEASLLVAPELLEARAAVLLRAHRQLERREIGGERVAHRRVVVGVVGRRDVLAPVLLEDLQALPVRALAARARVDVLLVGVDGRLVRAHGAVDLALGLVDGDLGLPVVPDGVGAPVVAGAGERQHEEREQHRFTSPSSSSSPRARAGWGTRAPRASSRCRSSRCAGRRGRSSRRPARARPRGA